jgi:EAL domain-containing protein (putative c-di-GMP-specific phosphodiesterase class I)
VKEDVSDTIRTGDVRGDGWYLETMAEAGRLRRVAISNLPFRIGRLPGLDLTLPADSVSKRHAEIYASGSDLRLRDLGSTNGTFVNRKLIEDAPIREADILHFADFEFRVGRSDGSVVAGAEERRTTSVPRRRELPHRLAKHTRELRELLSERMVTIEFQPIVLLPGGNVAAYEALGRGLHPELPESESPLELFRIAESIGAEAELSRLFRRTAVELARERRDLPTLFLNTHPSEFERPGLLESLEELREIAPHLDLALEIHESVLKGPAAIAELRALLLERNIALAYDDFGKGMARLLELADAPPHYLKFDRRFVAGLDHAPVPKRRMLQGLVSLAWDLRAKTVAEGIETEAEWRACAEIGFTHAQGFQLGRPRSIEHAVVVRAEALPVPHAASSMVASTEAGQTPAPGPSASLRREAAREPDAGVSRAPSTKARGTATSGPSATPRRDG